MAVVSLLTLAGSLVVTFAKTEPVVQGTVLDRLPGLGIMLFLPMVILGGLMWAISKLS